jgi:hypothetical protein
MANFFTSMKDDRPKANLAAGFVFASFFDWFRLGTGILGSVGCRICLGHAIPEILATASSAPGAFKTRVGEGALPADRLRVLL